MQIEELSSAKNPKIKSLVKLTGNSTERRDKGLFTVEGKKEIQFALSSGYEPVALYINSELSGNLGFDLPENINIFQIAASLYKSVAYRDSTEGAIAVFKQKSAGLESIKLKENPLVIVLESVEKPGNMGAIIRTADAAGADAVIICDPLTDIYNPNIIRSSLGCVFTTQVVSGTSQDVFKWLTYNKINIFAAELKASQWYHETDLTQPAALVLGTESTGLSDFWIKNSHYRIKIPMSGQIDSLNVSVSAAILCFEAKRQRNFK